MSRIFVIPDKLRSLGSTLKVNSENVYFLATQLRSVTNTLDWEIRYKSNIDDQVNNACKQARSLADRLQELSQYLKIKAHAFEDADRQSSEQMGKLSNSIQQIVNSISNGIILITNWLNKLWPFTPITILPITVLPLLPKIPWPPKITPIHKPSQPGLVPNDPIDELPIIDQPELPGGKQKVIGVISDLNVEQTIRYKKNHDEKFPDATYCNIFAMDFAKEMGVPLPEYLDLNGDGKIDDYLNANESVQWLRGTYNNPIGSTQTGAQLGWKSINADQAAVLASKGYVVIAGWENPVSSQPGHMAVVKPDSIVGELRIAQAGENNFSDGSLNQGFGDRPVEFFVFLP